MHPAGGLSSERTKQDPTLSRFSEGRDRNRNSRVIEGAAPELAARVVAPAVRRPGATDTAGVKGAGHKTDETQAPGDGDRDCATRGRAVAELPPVVIAPAIGCPSRGEPARVADDAAVGDARSEGAEDQSP